MRLTRGLLAVAVALGGLGVMSAAASLLPVTSARLASGDGAVPSCDPDGVDVSYTSAFDTAVADYRTTAVTVSGIHADCAGRALNVTVRAAGGAALWVGAGTVAGTSMTLSATPIRSSAIAGWAVSITG